jgi:hypothetical protein
MSLPRTCANGRQAAASVHIPSRLHFMNSVMGGGIRFAFSSGVVTTTKDGAKRFVATTTPFVLEIYRSGNNNHTSGWSQGDWN